MTSDVVVIGAGISGLAVAHGLQRRGRTVTVLESAGRAGGVIGTLRRDGALYERGPNSTLDTSPKVSALLRDAGLEGERENASEHAAIRYIVRNGALVALPSSPPKFFTTPAFSLGAKLALFREPFVAPTPDGVEESIAQFVRRRLGSEFLNYAIDPLVAGIYAGDPERVSVAAAFPKLLALEKKYGSLIKGQIQGARERKKSGEVAKNTAPSFSFKSGMQALTDGLARQLPGLECNVQVERIVREGGLYVVGGMRDGAPREVRARAVVLATPAPQASALVREFAPEAATALARIDYAAVAIVASLYRRADVAHSLRGFGFLVPRVEGRGVLGTLFSSSMFTGRAAQDNVLLTTFVGGRRNPERYALSDADMGTMVQGEMRALIGAGAPPLWQEVVRWPQAIPQYDLGHLERLANLDRAEAELPGFWFYANYRGGVSVSDRIAKGGDLAVTVDEYLGRAPG
ncbi:MAG: protoporphyrinogen oxidase [Burkholderiales bacterium]